MRTKRNVFDELEEAFDGLEEQLQGLEADLNSEETQAAFKKMTEEIERGFNAGLTREIQQIYNKHTAKTQHKISTNIAQKTVEPRD